MSPATEDGIAMSPTFSFLVPTHREDRPLARMLDSLAPQLLPGDEVIVIGDTFDAPLHGVERLVLGHYQDTWPKGTWRYLDHNAGRHSYGHDQLNWGIEHATGDWIHCNDDDDVYCDGERYGTVKAVEVMREAAAISDAQADGVPILFRFQSYHNDVVFWLQMGLVQRDTIGGHCLVAKNDGKIARLGPTYQGDFDYVRGTVEAHGAAIWREEIIAIARPGSRPAIPPSAVWS